MFVSCSRGVWIYFRQILIKTFVFLFILTSSASPTSTFRDVEKFLRTEGLLSNLSGHRNLFWNLVVFLSHMWINRSKPFPNYVLVILYFRIGQRRFPPLQYIGLPNWGAVDTPSKDDYKSEIIPKGPVNNSEITIRNNYDLSHTRGEDFTC